MEEKDVEQKDVEQKDIEQKDMEHPKPEKRDKEQEYIEFLEKNEIDQKEISHKVKRWLLLASAIAVSLLFLGAIGFIIFRNFTHSPIARVTAGIINMGKEITESAEPMSEKLGMEQITDMLQNGASDMKLRMNVTFPELSELTLGVDVEQQRDTEARKLYMTVDTSIANIKLLSAQLGADAQNAYIALPGMMEECVMVPYLTLGRDFNAAPWAGIFNTELPEDFALSIFKEQTGAEEPEEELFSDGFEQQLQEDSRKLAETIVIAKTGEPFKAERDGKAVNYEGFRITLGKEEANKLLEDLRYEMTEGIFAEAMKQQIMAGSMGMTATASGNPSESGEEAWQAYVSMWDLSLTEDLNLTVYLDKKDHIVHMTVEQARILQGDRENTLAADMDMRGQTRTLDDLEGNVQYGSEESGLTMKLTRKAENSNEKYSNTWTVEGNVYAEETEQPFTVGYGNDWNLTANEFTCGILFGTGDEKLELSAQGSVEDIDAGRGFTLQIGSGKLVQNDVITGKLFGSASIAPLEEAPVLPEDSSRELFGMSETEANSLLMEISGNLMKLFFHL